MASSLPAIDNKGGEKPMSMMAMKAQIRAEVESSLDDAAEPDSWKRHQMLVKLKEHEKSKRNKNIEQAKGLSYVAENREKLMRNRPGIKLRCLIDKAQRERNHSDMVVFRRNEELAVSLLRRNTRTSLHREAALERNLALRQFVLSCATHSAMSLEKRWIGVCVLASKTSTLAKRLVRQREKRKALSRFYSAALLVTKIKALLLKRRRTSSADKVIDFLEKLYAGKKWNKWILCFERVKRCVLRCQRRFRRKLALRDAHKELLIRQWQYEIGPCPGKVQKRLVEWMRKCRREHSIALESWERFELLPLLERTVVAKPSLIHLDLRSAISWSAQIRRPADFSLRVDEEGDLSDEKLEEFCRRVRETCRILEFVKLHGNITTIVARPRSQRLMTVREIKRLNEQIKS